ncbi:MAG: LAGLIDADG family homing endonuclease [Candidatus Nanoarchaeia archaeon]|jgi:hypothetical protein|nr:LAGLIDADG family homing endonuclease [Candidatus Nanoarchaeia archaeon]|tara:strand:- start:327 stop:977 length:651 start_codon:yes stop_codon:yes gene_type:complete
MVNLLKISQRLKEINVFHKIENELIITRRSKSRVPNIDEDISYLTGVITGDGSLIRSRRKRGGFHYILQITSGSRSYLEYLNFLFKERFNINGKIVRDKRKQRTFNLRIQNTVVFWYFVLIGLPIGKKKDIVIPKYLVDNKLKLSYMAGLIDTDGSIANKRIQLKQKDGVFLENISKELNKLNLNCSVPKVNYTDNVPFYYIRFNNEIPLRFKLPQ